MRFFADTNVLFDLFEMDRPSHKDSLRLFAHCTAGRADILLAPVSVMTLLYSLKKYGLSMDEVVQRLNFLLPHLTFSSMGLAELVGGINSGWTDLEDAILFHSALNAGDVDAIVSNDKDFKQQHMIPVLTPAQAVKRVK